MKKIEFKSAATLTVRDAGRMTESGRAEVVAWLRREARFLEKYWAKMNPRYMARFRYAKERP